MAKKRPSSSREMLDELENPRVEQPIDPMLAEISAAYLSPTAAQMLGSLPSATSVNLAPTPEISVTPSVESLIAAQEPR